MTDGIKVLPVGTKVTIGDGVPAVVTAVVVRSNGLTYEVAWWNGWDRLTEWLPPDELTTTGPASTLRIGFLAPRGADPR